MNFLLTSSIARNKKELKIMVVSEQRERREKMLKVGMR